MDCTYNVGTTILLGIRDSLKGIPVAFYLDKEANNRQHAKPTRFEAGRTAATKESLSAPADHQHHHHHFPRQQQHQDQAQTSPASANKDKRKDESKVLHRVIQCCVLNGGVFMFSILLFEYGVLPGLNFCLSCLFSNSGTVATVWSWMEPSLVLLFHSFWVVPLLLLSKLVNSLWFQDIADSAYKFRKGRPQPMPSISKLIADTLISLLVQVLFLLQSTVIKYLPFPVPYACNVLYLVHMSLLCSLYAFEYKWFNMGWELHKRLTYIETNWPYFIGFGLPLAVVSELPNSVVISGCVFSVLFPLFILSANEATPRVGVCETPLKLFSLVVAITNALFSSRTKLGKAALSAPINATARESMMMGIGRGMTPPLSSSGTPPSTPSLNYQLSQQQKYRQQQYQQQQQYRHGSPKPPSMAPGMGAPIFGQQPQAVINRNLRR